MYNVHRAALCKFHSEQPICWWWVWSRELQQPILHSSSNLFTTYPFVALFLSGKSQIVNISSLREIINSFCTYSFSISANWWFSVCYKLQQHSHLKLFYTLKEGEIWEHWLCYLLHILFAYASCCGVYHTLSTNALKSPATTPDTGEGQAWGGAA